MSEEEIGQYWRELVAWSVKWGVRLFVGAIILVVVLLLILGGGGIEGVID